MGWLKFSYKTTDSSGAPLKENSVTHTYAANIIPGVYYQATKRILISADCGGFSYDYYDSGPGSWTSEWSLNFLSNFTFGVDFILGKN